MNHLTRLSRVASLTLLLFLSTLTWSEQAAATLLRMSWTDNSTDESGFRIERKTGTEGAFSEIAVTGANLTSYVDDGLAPGTLYCYRVLAFNAIGTSAPSDEACATTTTLMAAFESPADNRPVSGIALIRGWAFDTQGGDQISRVELFIDSERVGNIPCCSWRGDVQAAFPNFPAGNTRNSGWGTAINWGQLSSGVHAVQVQVSTATGTPLWTNTRTVTVVKPGEFEFLDRFDLSTAQPSLGGDELRMQGVRVRDKATLQQREVDASFRWFASSQTLEMVRAVTVAEVSSLSSFLSSLVASLPAWFRRGSDLTEAQAASNIIASFDSPQADQVVSGIGVIYGWAFAAQGESSIGELQLLIDGQPTGPIPCCLQRNDVAIVFSAYPQALNSGWGVTFNYGLLDPGPHPIRIQLQDSAGNFLTLEHGARVVKVGGFEFLDEFDLSAAAVRIAGDEVVVEGVRVRDKASQQSKVSDVRLRWLVNSQALAIVSSS
jgi:Bacterial Ig domain